MRVWGMWAVKFFIKNLGSMWIRGVFYSLTLTYS